MIGKFYKRTFRYGCYNQKRLTVEIDGEGVSRFTPPLVSWGAETTPYQKNKILTTAMQKATKYRWFEGSFLTTI